MTPKPLQQNLPEYGTIRTCLAAGRQRPRALGGAVTTPVSPGDVIAGKYRVERVLGAGGMGVVVEARHLQLYTKVAIKFLLPTNLEKRDAMARFAREARAAARLKSEHVARVLDVGTLESGAPYMVMEYLVGSELSTWLRQRGALPVEDAVEILLQIAEALAEAHASGIVHRDLKPTNLFIVERRDGGAHVKVLDFGISKMAEEGVDATQTATILGSPLYMSPEQMRSAKAVDPRSDIWSLGVIFFEMLTGERPFEGDTLTELILKVTSEVPRPVRRLRPELPAAVAAVISRCLEKDRRNRFQSVTELAVALEPFAPYSFVTSSRPVTSLVPSGPNPPPARSALTADPPVIQASAATGAPWSRTAMKPGTKAVVGTASLVVVAGAAVWLAFLPPRAEEPGSPPPVSAIVGLRASAIDAVARPDAGPAPSSASSVPRGEPAPMVAPVPRDSKTDGKPASPMPASKGRDLVETGAKRAAHPTRSASKRRDLAETRARRRSPSESASKRPSRSQSAPKRAPSTRAAPKRPARPKSASKRRAAPRSGAEEAPEAPSLRSLINDRQ